MNEVNFLLRNKYLLISLLLISVILLLGIVIVKISPLSYTKPAQVTKTPSLEVELQGILRVVVTDNFKDKISSTEYFLQAGSNTYVLHFTKNPPAATPGSTIKVKGTLRGNDLFVNN